MELDFLKGIVDDQLLIPFLKLCQHDVVLQKAVEKSTDLKSLTNCLLASIVCIKAREDHIICKISEFVKAHPDIQNAKQIKEIQTRMK